MSEPSEKTLHLTIDHDGFRVSFDQVFVIYPIPRHADNKLADLLLCAVTAQELGMNNEVIGDEVSLVRMNGTNGKGMVVTESSEKHLPNVPEAAMSLRRKGKYHLGRNIEILPNPTLCNRCGMGCRLSKKSQTRK